LNNELERNLEICLKIDRVPFRKTSEEHWNEIKSRIDAPVVPLRSKKQTLARLAVAASFILFIASSLFHFTGIETRSNANSPMEQIMLPDGSIAKLNSGTSVQFNSHTWFINREVEMNEGEVFFQVKPGKKFTVKTDRGLIQVLGTSFNVKADETSLEVACKTGKVGVKLDGKAERIDLSPGKFVSTETIEFSPKNREVESIGSWTGGNYVYQDAPVIDVIESISYPYKYKVHFEAISTDTYSGKFSLDQPLEDILKTICLPMNLKFEIDEKSRKIIITK
jgi:ferric-dicitrate binding protein FerR (iron transport regulator)